MSAETIMIWSMIFVVMFVGCEDPPANSCVSIYYVELNAGTFSVIVRDGSYGASEEQRFGKYIRNKDGTITLTGGGNYRRRSGLLWHTIKIDPEMPQLSKYLHKNCSLCAAN